MIYWMEIMCLVEIGKGEGRCRILASYILFLIFRQPGMRHHYLAIYESTPASNRDAPRGGVIILADNG